MAYPDALIFQRTELGVEEIYNKVLGLTQSERLVLIIVDGVSTYGELRIKLKSIVKPRFDRALHSLFEKGLLLEVMFPLANQAPDLVEADVMDRFLHQEDTDPVTVISFDPDREFGEAEDEAVSSYGNTARASQTEAIHMPTAPPIVDSFPSIEPQLLDDESDEGVAALISVEPEPVVEVRSATTNIVDSPVTFAPTLRINTDDLQTTISVNSEFATEEPVAIAPILVPRPAPSEKKPAPNNDYVGTIDRVLAQYSVPLVIFGIALIVLPLLLRLFKS